MISRFLKSIKDLYRVNLEKKLSMSDMWLFLIGNGRFSKRTQWRRGPVRKEKLYQHDKFNWICYFLLI